MLYFRMLLSTLVTLYTSRVVLNTLGISDYGIYNVVAGVIVMFGFLNSAMAASRWPPSQATIRGVLPAEDST
jgi:hypothetical protein